MGPYWLKRAPQAIPRLDETLIPFSEERYLDRYPDVREAIGRGAFVSGRHHYDLFGKAEGRLPT
jgi:phytanoyl-CoA hydroxylase